MSAVVERVGIQTARINNRTLIKLWAMFLRRYDGRAGYGGRLKRKYLHFADSQRGRATFPPLCCAIFTPTSSGNMPVQACRATACAPLTGRSAAQER